LIFIYIKIFKHKLNLILNYLNIFNFELNLKINENKKLFNS